MSAFLILDSISLNAPDGHRLFDGLTLAIGRERTGLVGRNGSGKSTLLRLIAGDIEPATGAVQRLGSIGLLERENATILNGALAGVARDVAGAMDQLTAQLNSPHG